MLCSLAIAKIQAEILPRNAAADWEPKFGRWVFTKESFAQLRGNSTASVTPVRLHDE